MSSPFEIFRCIAGIGTVPSGRNRYKTKNFPSPFLRRKCLFGKAGRRGVFELLEERQVLSGNTLASLPDTITIAAGDNLYYALYDQTEAAGMSETSDVIHFSIEDSGTVSGLTADLPTGTNVQIEFSETVGDVTSSLGKIVFQLFESDAPESTGRFLQLLNEGFYDGLTIHRIVRDFVIQGGDPLGTGSGSSKYGIFADEFSDNLQHSRSGIVAFANHGSNTSDCQFYITTSDYNNHLDGKYNIFGFVTQGYDTLQTLNNKETGTAAEITYTPVGSTVNNSADTFPINEITMSNIQSFDSTDSGILRLTASENATGSSSVTVTATNQTTGEQESKTITVNIVPSRSELEKQIPETIELRPGSSTTVTMPEIWGDEALLWRVVANRPTYIPAGMTVTHNGNVLTINTDSDYSGSVELKYIIRSESGIYNAEISSAVHVGWDGPMFRIDGGTEWDETETVELTLTATEAEGTPPCIYTLMESDLPENAVYQIQTVSDTQSVFTWTPGEADNGIYNLTFMVTDSNGGQRIQTFCLTVEEINQNPVITTVVENEIIACTGQLYELQLEANDDDLPAQSLVWSVLSTDIPDGFTLSESGLIQWTPTVDQASTHLITVQVTDSAGGADTLDLVFVVQEVDLAPVFEAIGEQTVNQGELLSFTVKATDPNTDRREIEYTLAESHPEGMMLDPVTGILTWDVPADFMDATVSSKTCQITVIATEIIEKTGGTPSDDEIQEEDTGGNQTGDNNPGSNMEEQESGDAGTGTVYGLSSTLDISIVVKNPDYKPESPTHVEEPEELPEITDWTAWKNAWVANSAYRFEQICKNVTTWLNADETAAAAEQSEINKSIASFTIGKISREEMIKEIRQATAEHKARLTQNIADYQTRLAKITELANSQENQLATIKETLNVNETDSGTVLEDEEKVAKEEAADKISSEVPVDQKQRESSVFLYDSVTGKSAAVVNLRDAIKSWRSRSIPVALFESSAITFEVSDSLIESIFADSETVDTFFEE